MEAMAVGSLVMGAMGTMQQASMNAAGAEHAAQQAEFQAQTSRINASNTDAYYRDQLRTTLSSIDAIRGSAGMVDSPTAEAYKAEQTRISDQKRSTAVLSDQAQAIQSKQDAAFYNSAASGYMTAGYLGAASGFMGGVAKSPNVSAFLMGGF